MKRLVAVVACVGMLAGCGIGSGPVRPEGRRHGADQPGVDSAVRDKLTRPDGIREPIELVRRFLTAPADDPSARVATVGSFVEPGDHWLPNDQVHVIHIIDDKYKPSSDIDGNTTVEVEVQHVGILNDDTGQIEPPEKGFESLRFTVVERGADGLFISQPEQLLLMSDSALGSYFQARPIYFWSKDGQQLIPDLRYASRRQNETGRADSLLRWLYTGPSPWLAPAVALLPAGTQAGKKVTEGADGSLIVDLATEPGADDGGRLAKQLAKTLLSSSMSTLELRVAGIAQGRHYRPDDSTVNEAKLFGIVGGSVRRLGPNTTPVTLPEALNKNLVAVAFARGEQSAILVHHDGRVSLWRNETGVIPVQLGQAQPSGQPIWLDGGGTALILAGGRLYQIGSDGKTIQVSNADNISAFSLALDKTRVALVQGGRLGVATLVRGSNTVSLSQPRPVPTKLVRGVQNVAFGSQTELLVAGADATNVTLVWMNLDGGSQAGYPKDRFPLDFKINHMASWPSTSQVLFEVAGAGSFEAQRVERQPLTPASSSASPEPPGAKVSAPSFAG